MPEKDAKQVKWACRRGMLELDIFLLPFFEACYESLSADEKDDFIRLLSCTDPELFQWFMNKSQPEDKTLENICQKVRQFRLHDHSR